MFSALAFLVSLATAGIKIAFLTIDIKDAILAIGGFIYGPVATVPMCIVTSLLSSFITGFETGPFGLLMDFASSLIFVLVSSLIYKHRRTMNGAVVGLFIAVVVYTSAMVPLNLLITPLYTGQPVSAVVQLLVPLLVPFNFAKSVLNVAVVMLLYKPISRMLKNILRTKDETLKEGASLEAANEEAKKRTKMRSIIVTAISGIIVVVAFVIVFLVLGGTLA